MPASNAARPAAWLVVLGTKDFAPKTNDARLVASYSSLAGTGHHTHIHEVLVITGVLQPHPLRT